MRSTGAQRWPAVNRGRTLMIMRVAAQCGIAVVLSGLAAAASAQDRTNDNAVTQAEDAFGFSVGHESIGIYAPGQARGFSPTAAGNVRIDGLYFDPAFGLQGLLVDSISIKVGISAQGYPFTAPSGIVDQQLRRPASTLGASVVASGDSWSGASIEVDGSVPITNTLAIRVGANTSRTVFPNGTDNFNHTESLIARWHPASSVEIVPFWSRYTDTHDESGTFYAANGSFLPIVDRAHHDESPKWADVYFKGVNTGVLTNVGLSEDWVLRLGAFRSSFAGEHQFNHLLVEEEPDGTGERILIADPPSHNVSLSGEARLTHSIRDGNRLHIFHLSARVRDARREFGGSDTIDFGPGRVGERVTDPRPDFVFGEQTHQRTRQKMYGIAYDGRWKDVGEISVGVSKEYYDKATDFPGLERVEASSAPLLYNGTAAVIISPTASLYAGYSRGLEESGTAPPNAANRNEPLPSILTQQKDAGVRFEIVKEMKAVVGVFDISRPYFGFDSANVFGQVGSIRARGAEFSVSGTAGPKLNLVFGGVLLRPRVEKSADAQGDIGSKPVGIPSHILTANANWATPFVDGLQFDVGLSHRGKLPSTVNNLVFLPSRFTASLGSRYRFNVGGKPTVLRVQATNLFDNQDITGVIGPGIYQPRGSRQINASVTVDL